MVGKDTYPVPVSGRSGAAARLGLGDGRAGLLNPNASPLASVFDVLASIVLICLQSIRACSPAPDNPSPAHALLAPRHPRPSPGSAPTLRLRCAALHQLCVCCRDNPRRHPRLLRPPCTSRRRFQPDVTIRAHPPSYPSYPILSSHPGQLQPLSSWALVRVCSCRCRRFVLAPPSRRPSLTGACPKPALAPTATAALHHRAAATWYVITCVSASPAYMLAVLPLARPSRLLPTLVSPAQPHSHHHRRVCTASCCPSQPPLRVHCPVACARILNRPR